MWQGSGRTNREYSDRTGRVDTQHVVEGGGGINECCAGGITVLYGGCLFFLRSDAGEIPKRKHTT